MSKGKIITISIISFIILLGIVLFSFVFCVRKQTVKFSSELSITEQQILDSANIKNGKPIFMLNKEQATANIEQKYPNIKVIQIKTTSFMAIEIVVRERYALYYTENEEQFYVLDEDLKVLDTTETEPLNLIKIETKLNVTAQTKKADFLGTTNQQTISSNLFIAMYSAVLNSEDNQARIDMASLVKSIKFEEDKLLVITHEDVKLEIAKPNFELINKINICFSAIEELTAEQKNKTTIKILYNADGTEYKGYVSYAE